jgi:lipopolysaccharide transport system ATP-binding protein
MGTVTAVNLGKAYKQYPSRWARIVEWLYPSGVARHQLHWVLKDVNFSIHAGEAVGIVGVNGAGKSTLLKMITGTTQPNAGTVQTTGSVAALLELGMGFHPDFTGRQNALMAGQLLGMQPEEIIKLMPEIEAFASIGEYIDQPVRVYSSGMQVRLAFAVATCKRPDILIVDEALSVGDAAFQRKCFQRIEGYRAAGTTLLLVTHDVETVKKICDRAIFIKNGTLFQIGPAKQVCDQYEQYLFGGRKDKPLKKPAEVERIPNAARFDPGMVASCETIYGNGEAEIEACWLADLDGNRINIVESGEPFRWCYRVRFNEDVTNPKFAMMLKTLEGISIFGTDSELTNEASNVINAGRVLLVEFSLQNLLAPGIYYFNCGVRVDTLEGVRFLSRRVDAALLRVTASKETTVIAGLLEMKMQMEIKDLVDD